MDPRTATGRTSNVHSLNWVSCFEGISSFKFVLRLIDFVCCNKNTAESVLLEYYLDYADQLLNYFVQLFCNLYGKDQLVYSDYSLIYLAEDVRRYGAHNNISSFYLRVTSDN
jgi:hypothetical protein